MSDQYTVRVVNEGGWLSFIVPQYRYEVINPAGKIVAATDFPNDANTICFQYNTAKK